MSLMPWAASSRAQKAPEIPDPMTITGAVEGRVGVVRCETRGLGCVVCQ